MTEATKSIPAPLDAFETAKPDEPIWTVQGGDPLGAPLLRLWAVFARIQAGRITPNCTNFIFEELLKASQRFRVDTEDAENNLLARAYETEQISWQMDDYFRGLTVEEIFKPKDIDDFAKLDIHDLRRRCANLISQFFSELNDYREELRKREWVDDTLDDLIEKAVFDLRVIMAGIEIRRER